jgi:hypothetical protein
MAEADEVLLLREYILEPDDANGWTDERLGGYIDRAGSVKGAAAEVWDVKAAEVSDLVNVSENGSSRNLSDLFKNAQAMAGRYRTLSGVEIAVTSGGPRTRAIIRP